MKVKRPPRLLLLLSALVLTTTGLCQKPQTEFIPLADAEPALHAYSAELPPQLHYPPDAASWTSWLKAEDSSIRKRLETGEEDTLTNLLRWGVTFTSEYQINREYLAKYGNSTLVNAFAEKRATDLVRALASPGTNQGMQQMRAFLIKQGYSFTTPRDRELVKKHLLENLARMRDEFTKFREKLKTADAAEEGNLYAQRGISLDSNLWPDYALDRALNELVKAGMLKSGGIRRIAIVGPGLDFANKEFGNDFYPPQSIQPFAVLDSLIRLGLTSSNDFQLYTLDISPSVNIHLDRVQKNAGMGKPYVLQLPWNSEVPFSPEYFAAFQSYWQTLGDRVGTPATPAKVPVKLADNVHIRAVSIRPAIASRINPVDMNIVFQRMTGTSPNQKFDLIVGTNIFIYYGAFEQSLARSNLSAMLNPGGFALSNDLLADKAKDKLQMVHQTDIEVRSDPQIIEHVYCYQRQR